MRALLLSLALILCAAPAVAQTSIFDLDNRLVQFALRQISSPGSFEITADLVEDAEGATRLNGVKVSDGTGIWLTIDQLVVDWNSSAILRGQLDLDRVIVRGLDMTRAPSPNAEAPTVDVEQTQGTPSPFDWPRAPIPVIVDQMTLEDIRIGPDVLGQSLTFDGTGSARDQGDEQRIELNITRSDDIDGEIAFTYLRDFAERTLGIELEAQEEAGGIVALLAGFPEDSASRVSLSGSGPRDDWQLTFDAETDDVFEAEGEATVSYVEPLSVQADFVLVPGPEMSPTVRAVTGERAQLVVDIEQGADRVVRINDLDLESPALQLDGTGTFDLDTQTSDLRIILDGREELAGLIDGVIFDGFTFEGEVTGPPTDLTAVGQASVRQFRSALVDAERVALDLNVRRIDERLRVTANGTGTGLRLDQLDEDTVGEARLRLDLTQEGEQVELTTLRLDSPLLTLSAEGTTDTTFQNADLSLDFAADSIRRIAAAYGQEASGEVSLIGRVQRVEGVLDGRLSGRVNGFETDAADVERLDLVVEIGQQGEEIGLTLDSEAQGLRLDRLGPDLLGEARIDARVVLGPEAVRVESLTLDSQPLSITATATQERETGLVTFDARVQSTDAEPLAAAYDIDLSGRLDMQAEGTFSNGVVNATTTTRLIEPRYADIASAERIDLDANVIGGGEDGYTVRATLAGVEPTVGPLGPEALGQLQVETEASFIDGTARVANFELTSRAANATASGQIELESGDALGQAELDIRRLEILAAVFDLPLEGRLLLEAEGSRTDGEIDATIEALARDFAYGEIAQAGTARIRATARGEMDDLVLATVAEIEQPRIDRLTADVLGTVRLDATARLEDGQLASAQAELDSDALNLTVEPSPDGSRLDYTARVVELSRLARVYDVDAGGRLAANGVVTLGATPALDGTLVLDEARFGGNRLGDLVLDHDVTLGDTIRGDLALRGRNGLLANTDASLDLAFADNVLNVTDLNGAVLGQQLTGRARVDLGTLLTDAVLDVSRLDLGQLPVADLQGTGSGRVVLTPQGGTQSVEADLTLNDAVLGGIPMATASVDARITNALSPDPGIDAQVRGGGLALGGADITTLRLDANGRLSALEVRADADGTTQGQPISFTTAATVNAAGGQTSIRVRDLSADYGNAQIALGGPLDVRLVDGGVQTDGLILLLPGEGRVTGDVDLIGGGLVGNLQVQTLDLAVLADEIDIPVLAGLLTADLTFDTRPSRATASLDATLRDFVGSDVLEEGLTVDAVLDADWNGRTVEATARIDGGFGEPFDIVASIPVALQGGPVPQPLMNAPMSATVRWAGEVRPLWAFVPAPGQILSGLATIDLDIGGTLAEPQVGGNVSLSDGRYENLDVGTILTEVTVISDIDPSGNLALDLQASDGADGFLFGRVELVTGNGPLLIDAEVTAEEAVLLRRDDLVAQISGTVTADGPLTALAVAGDLNIDRAEFRLINANPPEIPTLGDVRILGEPVEEREPSAPTSITLDIDVRAANGLFVRGRGLESEWRLALDIRGTAADPRITGQIERLRGTFTLIGRNFDLAQGEITFDGGQRIDPRLNIVLSRTEDDLTGQIIISGFASDPQIDFASQPALPEEEVLPQLLFGQSQQSLSAGQALQLASGIATLASGNTGPFDLARNALGVDVLQIDAGQGGEGSSLTVGKTLGEGVFVGAETALDGSGENVFVIELDVIRNVVIDARIGAGGEASSSVGITYSRDF
ncbi:translocation/assembly module TamB domain-containing protein [Roseobacter sp. HKCCA0434]|uniref:translocation/assembly module TamB domain-containing protein n=1 Tax=Roseobacter sp. HKCCA0434 TaxID=3079297 RepID=UPI002905B745|nr:translocation/assembly module TamB domain-containing protein [Roseobacter sp. HKCCA0434]